MISCADLSHKINKSLPHTMAQLNDLIEKGFVQETGYAPSTGGRRPQMYSLRPDFMFIISVAMDQLVTRIVVMNMQNQFVTEVEKFDLKLQENHNALAELTEKIEQHIKRSGIGKQHIAGVGIGMPGFVDVTKGLNYSFLETKSKNIVDYISEKLGLTVYIDNDSSLVALAELKFGIVQEKKNAMVVNIGWGVGLGLVLDGELFRGTNGFAGEFSHIPLFTNNKLCSCGKTGCLETETSLFVIVEKARESLRKGELSGIRVEDVNNEDIELAFDAIRTASLKGDKFAIELFSEAGYNIGRGVAILIHLLNPEVVILSGRGSLAGKIWQAPIQQALNEHCIPRLSENTEIKISALGHQAELIGSAALVMENYEKDAGKKNMKDKIKRDGVPV
ncbi:MAG: ROK family protein [Bacteroidetes bacterium]|nr:ROK family protein [Bacteroidota bacterium]